MDGVGGRPLQVAEKQALALILVSLAIAIWLLSAPGFFGPVRTLPYGWAVAAWIAITVAGYYGSVYRLWHGRGTALPDWRTVALVAAAFPPLWYLVLHGQTTVVIILAFTLAWMALERGRPELAGLALGLLACQPQWAPIVGLVILARREWHMLAGMLLTSLACVAVVWLTVGPDPAPAYALVIPALPPPPVDSTTYAIHSLRSWADLLPVPLGDSLWLVAFSVIGLLTVHAWRLDVPVTHRMAILVVAAALTNRDLTVYDTAVLALPILWWAGMVRKAPSSWPGYYRLVYLLWITLLVPAAMVIKIQLSAIVLLVLFWQALRRT